MANDSTKPGDATKFFGGWTVDGTTPVDWSAPVAVDAKGEATVKPLWLTNGYTEAGKSDLAQLDFSAVKPYATLPAGDSLVYVKKDAPIPSTLLPVDLADGKLVTEYTYSTNSDSSKKTVAAADLASVTTSNATVDQLKVTFDDPAPEENAYVVTVDGTDKAQYGYVKGAKSDGDTNYDTLKVDVARGVEFTVPDWFTVPQTSEPNQTVTSWTDTTHNSTVVGNKLTVASDTTLEPTKDAVAKGYKTTFLDANGAVWETTDAAKNDKGDYFVTVPTKGTPSKDGFKFAGWKAKTTGTPFGTNTIKATSDGTYPAFVNTAINQNITFEPVFDNRDTKLVVTFRDASYNGSQKDVTVEVKVPGTLEKSQAPQWTRAGYTLTWLKDGSKYNFDEWLTDANANFTLTAKWDPATPDKAHDALNYIMPKDLVSFYNHVIGETVVAEGFNKPVLNDDGTPKLDASGKPVYEYVPAGSQVNDGSDFTKDSFDAYEAAYKAAVEKYGTDVYNNPNTEVTAEASAEIINDINAALEKLQFKHEGGAEEAAYGKFQGVHRLYNPSLNRHLYSNDVNEIRALTSTESTKGGWEDNGVLFYGALGVEQTTDQLGATNRYVLASDSDQAKAGVESIVKQYVRFFNPSTGDHVYTALDGSEDKDLSANSAWNREGVAFVTPAFTGTQDVNRLYNKGTDRHLFSSSADEQAGLVKDGWTVEGLAAKGV